MNELSLFTGAGGGLLGTKLLGFNHIGYVEINEYCQKIIAQRIKDGILDEAPIFGDIRTFISEGYAESYQGMVDVITAGFPCQPFSITGERQGKDDRRNMWPDTIEAVRIIRPKRVYLENVSGIFNHKYIRTIFSDLAEIGFHCRWDCLGASDVGADHHRPRAWIIAYASGNRLERSLHNRNNEETSERIKERCEVARKIDFITRIRRHPQPPILGKHDDVANWMDRIEAIGNGQVPRMVATAWRILNDSK